ncbi:hypothetical protein ACFL1C_06230 [Pseudomonadota bacterium]
MLRIFRKNKNKPGAVQDVQLRPAETSGQDALELRLEDTRRQLGRRGGFVYVETSRETPALGPFPEWKLAKEKVMGEVRMQLLKKD